MNTFLSLIINLLIFSSLIQIFNGQETNVQYVDRPTVQIENLNFQKEKRNEIRIKFGSCYGLNDTKNDIFKTIGGLKFRDLSQKEIEKYQPTNTPDIFIWGGDVAYTDKFFSFLMDDKDGYNSVEYIKQKYNQTQDYPFYMEMINKGTKVIGVWDDHDYGLNNGDKNFPLKNEVRDIFLDFIKEPQDSPRRLDKNSSIHQDYFVEYKMIDGNIFKIHIILLDNRFNFDKQTGDYLGDQQWQWLDNSLQQNQDSNLTFILAGLQIQSETAWDFQEKLNWINKEKLYQIINKNKKSGLILLSGDIHYSYPQTSACSAINGGYRLVEFTSSGLTHSDSDVVPFAREFMHFVTPMIYTLNRPFVDINYGDIVIWPEKSKVRMSINDLYGNSVFTHDIQIKKDLNFNSLNLQKNPKLCKVTQTDHLYFVQLITKLGVGVKFTSEIGWFKNNDSFIQTRKYLSSNLLFILFFSIILYVLLKSFCLIISSIYYIIKRLIQ